MYCTYHVQNQVSLICIATHKCELNRKMCVECQQEHGVDLKQTLPLKQVEEMVKNKFKEFQLDDTSDITKERMKYKAMLSQTESSIKNILDEISKLFEQTFDRVEQESKSFTNLINNNPNLASISNSELNKLVEILQWNNLNDFIIQKNLYLVRLENSRFWWEQEVQAFGEKLKTVMNQYIEFFRQQFSNFQSVKPVSLDADLIQELEMKNQAILEYKQIFIDKKQLLNNEIKTNQNEMIDLQIELDVLKLGDTIITVNVKSFSTNVSQTFQMQLRDSISDLYILAVNEGIHKGSPLDCCLLVPSKNIKYASSEWKQRFQEIFIPNDYTNKTITLEFCQYDIQTNRQIYEGK
ncbi:unnamed protein product (macronuclear) [Paramecium tetraurelia]|uniref:Uncharacterized protein n=1 Tax=Paramecium tetraurelia TaxID=5888 RepID=A0D3M2_PARTE|nr:uncharacterized protein GSPATT00013127001 [Paramecium tetraurelia]CAK77639.1 unnamed protein product [Paramecium tetraurelia]|eukprot:XP_001445036.1 hypothetical protein (macronuclear) [Paramecium tetraurelia strain d4-2]